MSAGSNRKNLASQLGRDIPKSVEMKLDKVTTASRTFGDCFTCKLPIEVGQRVRWCAVVGFIPAGYIHATHFDAGSVDADGGGEKIPQRAKKDHNFCKRPHRWMAWTRAGVFDPTEVRNCIRCPAKQTRRPKSSG